MSWEQEIENFGLGLIGVQVDFCLIITVRYVNWGWNRIHAWLWLYRG